MDADAEDAVDGGVIDDADREWACKGAARVAAELNVTIDFLRW